MTVREAFEKAYGPVPEGATCHCCFESSDGDTDFFPVIKIEGVCHLWYPRILEDGEVSDKAREAYKEEFGVDMDEPGWGADQFTPYYSQSPDISDLPAWVFGPDKYGNSFFGPEYDRVVAESKAKEARVERAVSAIELLEAAYPDDPIGTLERLIAADKEAHRQWRAEQKKEIDAFFDEAGE